MIETKIELEGLTCSACAKLAKKRLEKIADVESVAVLENGETKILSNRAIDKKELALVLADTDYKVK